MLKNKRSTIGVELMEGAVWPNENIFGQTHWPLAHKIKSSTQSNCFINHNHPSPPSPHHHHHQPSSATSIYLSIYIPWIASAAAVVAVANAEAEMAQNYFWRENPFLKSSCEFRRKERMFDFGLDEKICEDSVQYEYINAAAFTQGFSV